MPERIQLRRTKGYRKPDGAVVVDRRSPWGNPFPMDSPWLAVALGYHGDKAGRRAAAVAVHRAWLLNQPVHLPPLGDEGGSLEFADGTTMTLPEHVRGISAFVAARNFPNLPERPDITPLRGRDLACWCPLDQPCHADVLLEIANAEVPA